MKSEINGEVEEIDERKKTEDGEKEWEEEQKDYKKENGDCEEDERPEKEERGTGGHKVLMTASNPLVFAGRSEATIREHL